MLFRISRTAACRSGWPRKKATHPAPRAWTMNLLAVSLSSGRKHQQRVFCGAEDAPVRSAAGRLRRYGRWPRVRCELSVPLGGSTRPPRARAGGRCGHAYSSCVFEGSWCRRNPRCGGPVDLVGCHALRRGLPLGQPLLGHSGHGAFSHARPDSIEVCWCAESPRPGRCSIAKRRKRTSLAPSITCSNRKAFAKY